MTHHRPVRVWPAAVLLAIYWTFLAAHHVVEMAMLSRFLSRFAAMGLLILLFSTWWLTNRTIRLRDRFLAFGVMIVAIVTLGLISDPTIGPTGMVVSGVAACFTAWILWLLVARRLPPTVQQLGIYTVTWLVFGYFTLLRWEGLDGAQRSVTAWRWTPTAEKLFLQRLEERPDVSINKAKTGLDSVAPWVPSAGDWLDFRGPGRLGVVAHCALPEKWDSTSIKPLWRRRVGPSWSSMIVVDGHLVTLEQWAEQEAVVCYGVGTGEEVWVHKYESRFEEGLSGTGPRSTPTFADNRVVTVGAQLQLRCLEATTGKLTWSRDLAEKDSAEVPQWGYSASPLVIDGLVVVHAGGASGKGLVAFRIEDGEEVWARPMGGISYSSPQVVTLLGKRQLLMYDSRSLTAVKIDDGATLWQRPTGRDLEQPMIQAHPVNDNRLLISADPGVALVEVERGNEQWQVKDVWVSQRLKPGFNDVVVHQGHVYGLDDGILCCLDLATGTRIWKQGRHGHGQLLLVPDSGLIIVMAESGEVVVVAASPEQYDERFRFQAIEGKTWNHPVLVGDLLVARNGAEMAAFRIANASHATQP